MRILSWILFILVVIVEGTVTSIPLTLIFLLCLTVMKRQEWIFLIAFIAGLFLDSFALRTLGITSLFLVSFIFLIQLYQRKYETATMQFVVLASFFGSLWYLISTGSHAPFLQALLSTGICAAAFAYYRSHTRSNLHDGFLKV